MKVKSIALKVSVLVALFGCLFTYQNCSPIGDAQNKNLAGLSNSGKGDGTSSGFGLQENDPDVVDNGEIYTGKVFAALNNGRCAAGVEFVSEIREYNGQYWLTRQDCRKIEPPQLIPPDEISVIDLTNTIIYRDQVYHNIFPSIAQNFLGPGALRANESARPVGSSVLVRESATPVRELDGRKVVSCILYVFDQNISEITVKAKFNRARCQSCLQDARIFVFAKNIQKQTWVFQRGLVMGADFALHKASIGPFSTDRVVLCRSASSADGKDPHIAYVSSTVLE